MVQHRKLCRDTETHRLALGLYTSPTSCLYACEHTPGCKGFAFQANDCAIPSGIRAGSCYLWDIECELSDDTCWDHYDMPNESALPATWELTAARTGCANWESIGLEAETATEMSAGACGLRCNRDQDCVAFNYQPSNCTGTDDDKSQPGSCLLFKGQCQEGDNHCWDLYTRTSWVMPA